jgi:cell division septation protein DedD
MAAGGRAGRGTRRPRLWTVALGLIALAVLGFGMGMVAGALWEEPSLVASFLAGDTEEVVWGSERALPSVAAGTADPSESGSSQAAAPAAPKATAPPPDLAPPKATAPPPDLAPPKATAPPPDLAPQPTGTPSFAVQVGAFADGDAAERLAESLRAKGYAVTVAAGTGAGAPRWRVRVGPLASREEADAAAARLKREERLPTWVLNEEQQ